VGTSPVVSSPTTSIASPLAATFAIAMASIALSAFVTTLPSRFRSAPIPSVRKYFIEIASASFAIASNKD
jgi:hypothetical protein